MLKKVSYLLLAALFVATLSWAAAPAIEGTVQKVDKNSITVQVGSDQKTFTYDHSLKFTVNGKHSVQMSVKPGDKASVVADKNNVAEKIDIQPQSGTATGSSH